MPRGNDALRIAAIRRAFPRGDEEDLNLRVPRDGPGGQPPEMNAPDLNVRAPLHETRGLLPGLVVWCGAANRATQEGLEPRHAAAAAAAAVAACAAGVCRNVQKLRNGVHAVGRGG